MIDSTDLVLALRREQIAVLHAVRSAVTPGGRRLVVVFLESSYGQADQARDCLARLPDVEDIAFARHTRAIMYVFLESGAVDVEHSRGRAEWETRACPQGGRTPTPASRQGRSAPDLLVEDVRDVLVHVRSGPVR